MQQRLRFILRGARIGLWDFNLRTNTVYFSPEWKQQLGYEDHEIGAHASEWENRLHPDDHDKVMAQLDAYLKKPWDNFEIEYRLRHKNGSYRWILGQAALHLGTDGKPERMVGCHIDITERKQAAQALQKQKEEERVLLDHVPAMIWYKDTENRFLCVNKPAADAMGLRVQDIEGKSAYELCPDKAARYHAEDREVIRTGCPRLGIIEAFTTGSGSKRWLQTDKYPYCDGAGNIIGVTVFAQDITDRKEAESVLRQAHDKLEQMVKERTRALQAANEELQQEIVEHKHTEESLRESEAKAKELMEQASDAMFISDSTGRFLQANSKALQVLGYDREELLQLSVVDTYSSDESTMSEERQRRIMDGESLHFERRMRRKNGTFFPAEISVKSLQDGRCLGIVRDVTKRKLTEEALRQSEERFRSLFETAQDTIFTLSPQGTITSLNAAFEIKTGWSREAWIGKNFAPLVYAEDLPLAMESLQTALQGVTPPVLTLRFPTSIGTELVGEISVTPQIDNGQVVGVLGVARDVTDRLQSERTVRESEAKFRTLTETVDAAAFIFQGEKLLYVNPAAEAITGYTREELLGLPFWDVIDPEFQDMVRQRGMARQQGKKLASRYEVKIRTRTGASRWVEFTAGMIDYEGRPAVLGTAFDITVRKEAEEALRSQTNILQSILNSMSEGVVVADAKGKFLLWNPAADKMTGIGLTESPPDQWSRTYGAFHPDMVTPFQMNELPLMLALNGEATDDVEMFIRNAQVRAGRFISVSGRPLKDEHGNSKGGVVVMRDISERKRAEEELRQSEARGNAILNAVPDLMFRLSRSGQFLDFKANKPEELWVNPKEFVGKSVRAIMPPKFAQQTMHFIEETLRTGTMQLFEYQLPLRGQMQDYEARLVVSGPDEVLSIVRNITQHKKLERQILEISDREQRRIGQDLHDGLCQHLIGTAFASKVLEQKLAEKTIKESADAREIADLIEQGITQARNLARGLYPAQLESGGLVLAIEQLASNVENLFGIPCTCQCDPAVRITERGVTMHLYRIAQEAINNSIKHGKAQKLTLALSCSKKSVVMTISDDGVGLPQDSKENKGMGLNIMRYRAQMIGATVEVRRAGVRGTVVTCTLPHTETNDGQKKRRNRKRKA